MFLLGSMDYNTDRGVRIGEQDITLIFTVVLVFLLGLMDCDTEVYVLENRT